MKRLITFILTAALCAALAVPAMAADYSFGSGPDSGSTFGNPTSSDVPVMPDPMSQNTRRNKDAAALPPPYGIFSGNIPTDPSSPYHDNLPSSGFVPADQQLPPVGDEWYAPGGSDVATGLLPSTSQPASINIAPLYYADGSIGTLHIPKLNKTIKVFEGESLENMKKGIGHFESTSAWDGNVALAGHNRGAAAYFGFVKDLAVGDAITYTTQYGTRTYKVYHKEKISETDYSGLGWSVENIISMITCVENEPAYRWLVQAHEVR
ncbi:MAG: sortase [Oscillospiraceae bacterium]|nr:sortase [Oscillospiraceae bacterium]